MVCLFESEDERVDALSAINLNHLEVREVLFDKASEVFLDLSIGILAIEDGEDGLILDFIYYESAIR